VKIAVLGAGIFGCTTALKLRERFETATIEIFEKTTSILSSASGINQYRLHRGYHYPRSSETVAQVLEGVAEFERYFHDAVVETGFDRYYGIAKSDSKVDSSEYLDFLEKNNLEYEIIKGNDLPLHENNLDLIVKVKENSFDSGQMYLILTERLRKSGIKVRFGQEFKRKDLNRFDLVINCTYANLNSILPEQDQLEYQFELCEKALVSLGKEYQKKGIVILDGEFCCIDPFGRDKYFHVIGHVKEAIHETQVGKQFKVPSGYNEVLNSGVCKSSLSRFPFILNGCTEFFKFEGKPVIPESSKGSTKLIGNVHYQGSMFTVRTVLPNRDHDDARPSYITKHSDSLYSIFSGKIGTSIQIANQLKEMI
jgi:D-amino-acid oxidase